VSRSLIVAALVALSIAILPAAQDPPAPPSTEQPPPQPVPDAARRAPGTAQTPAFRTGIDLVSLNVTVSDAQGHYVTDLDEPEFQVFENGVKQDLTFFSRRRTPIALSMLLDSSASMENKLPTLQAAATSFVRRLKPDDMAEIVDFDGNVTIRQKFTSNHADLERGIQQTVAGGSTALHNAVYIALKGLKKVPATAEEEPRRQAIVVFSDGMDTSSLMTFDDVLNEAKRSETAIYTIGLRDEQDHVQGFRQAEFVLRQLALETGGRSFFPSTLSELEGVYLQIADELASQYALGYISKNPRRDGAWRPIVVQVTRPHVTTRTKRGYYAPTSSPR
jgi:Ca-activated chloride channel family protein